VDTIALSKEQKTRASERIKEAGLSAHIKVHFIGFRDVMKRREWQHSFDRFISLGALETFGREKLMDFWRLADWSLTTHSSVGVVQAMTNSDHRLCSPTVPPSLAHFFQVLTRALASLFKNGSVHII
jgi:cyclopropane fatty-acyl-phospholipid synthase-like methyltransferase